MSEEQDHRQDSRARDEETPRPETLVPDAPKRGPRALVVGVLIALLVLLGVWRWGFRGRIDSKDPGLGDTPAQTQRRSAPPKREPLTLVGEILLEDYPEGHDPTAPPAVAAPENEACRVRVWQSQARLAFVDACIGNGHYELRLDGEVNGKVEVEIWASGWLRAVVEVEVEGRGRFELPTVVLGRGHVLAGQVVDAKREALAGVVVEARPDPDLAEPIPWRTVSDATGKFRFDNMPFGPVILRGKKPDYAESVVEAISPTDEVLLVMEGLTDLSGEVIAEAGLLRGAKARVEGSGVWPPVEVDVAEDGKFIFPGLLDGVYGVEVYVQGDAQEYASIPLENVEPSMRVSLALVPAFRVPAVVVDPEGNAVPDARVTLSNARVGLLQKISTTDLVGASSVGPVVPGPYWLRADADGYLPAPPVPVDVQAEKGGLKEPIKLVLARPAILAGVVVDEQGNPVPGAQVRLESDDLFSVGEVEARADLVRSALRKGEEGIGSLGVTTGPVPPIPTADEADMVGGEAWLTALTDASGQFRFDMLAPGSYRLVAREGAHAESKEVTVGLLSGQLKDDLTLRLREGSPLTGRVLDGNGQPLPWVSIEAGGEFFTTDESGSFDLGLRRGKVRVIARAPGMVPKVVQATVKSDAIDLAVELEPADGAVDLRLVDANGTPIKDVEVVLQSADGLTPTVIAWSDDGGRVQLEQLTPGKSTLRFAHPDYVMKEFDVRVEHLSASLELQEFELDPGWSVELIVRAKASGERLKGALVVVDGRATTSDEDGKAVVSRLEAASVEVKVSLAGWAPASSRAKRPKDQMAAEVLVELEEVGSLEGTLGDDVGDPVVGASVQAFDSGGHQIAETKSGPGGVFRFDALPEGAVRIVAPPPPAQAELWDVARVESDVRRGERTKEVHLRFERR